jgi:hypothetical protein
MFALSLALAPEIIPAFFGITFDVSAGASIRRIPLMDDYFFPDSTEL